MKTSHKFYAHIQNKLLKPYVTCLLGVKHFQHLSVCLLIVRVYEHGFSIMQFSNFGGYQIL